MKRHSNIGELEKDIQNDEKFHNEIKSKRLKKQLQMISEKEIERYFQKIQYIKTPIGFSFHVPVCFKNHNSMYQLRIDHQYPFNRPQIFLLDDKRFGECRDLLNTVIEHNIWGPSLMLSEIIEKIPQLERQKNIKPNEIKWTYHKDYQYFKQQLTNNRVQIFEIDYYQWRYMIKSTLKRVLGLCHDAFLIFSSTQNQEILKLEDWFPIQKVRELNTFIKDRKFQIGVEIQNKIKKFYFGNSPDLEIILQLIDPVLMAQRRVQKIESSKVQNNQQLIQDYSTLIEFYSLKDKTIMNKYIQSMKKILQTQYSNDKMLQNQVKQSQIQK